jgi:dipeptidyl aminopeptidase/acylaminoacyl peptidase
MPWDAAERVDLDRRSGTIATWRPSNGAVQQPRFTPDGRRTHVDDRTGWLNVRVLDPADGSDADDRAVVPETVEHAGPTWGAGQRSYAWSDDGRRLAFTRNEAGFGSLCVVDATTGHIDEVARGVHGQLGWLDDDVIALRTGARTPTSVVRYRLGPDGPAERDVLAVGPPVAWDAVRRVLPEPDLVEEVVDGITLHARRYVAGRGRLLVWVHGGPTDQWQVDWRPRISYWCSRGWDVLVVDPRGSTGHGRDYQQALRGAWGRLDVDDTAALVRAAHHAGWATAETTVAIGGSSGGLTVLGLLADHPELVAGGVASYPVSDLRALTEVDHRFEAHYTDTLVAPLDDPDADARFRELSPVHRAGRITGPLLVFHGADDPVVPVAQSEELAAAVSAAGGEIELVVYDGEGHGFRDPDNVGDEYERTEAFLDRVVAGFGR